MSIAEKLTAVAENVPKVYEAGKRAECDAFWDIIQQNGERKTYSYVFAGHGWTDEILDKIKYPLKPKTEGPINYHYAFYYCTNITKTPLLYFNHSTQVNGMFHQCTKLKEVNFEGPISVSISFAHSPLAVESIVSVVEALLSTASGESVTFLSAAINNADWSTTDYASWDELVATKPNWTFILA